jgi:hypothetical protein
LADFTESEMANIGLFLLHTPRQLYAGLSEMLILQSQT